MPRPMNISEAAQAADVTAKMIRHYEQIGLVPAASRTDAGYRQYSAREVSILRFIRQSRRLGFSIDQIAELLGLWSDDGRASREVKLLAQGHLATLEEKMSELAAMQRELKKLIASCHGDDDPHCAILDELAVSSPQAPEPGEVGAKPVRRTSAQKYAPQSATQPSAAAHADLMAWTRSLRPQHGQH